MKRQIIIAVCFLTLSSAYAQSGKNSSNNRGGKVHVALSIGPSFFGPAKNIEDAMRANGYDHTSPADWFGGPIDHPKTNIFPYLSMQCTYFSKPNTGLTVSYGLVNNVEVIGYNPSGFFGNYIFLRSKIHLVSLAYTYQSDKYHVVSIGPAILIHAAKDEDARNQSTKNNIKPAVQLGYSLKFYNGKTCFVALDTHCSLSPKSEIGPFGRGENAPTLPQMKVNTASLYIGLALGLKL